MDLDFLTWNNLIYLIGEITVIIIFGALLTAFILVIISLYSIKKGRLYFPTLIRSGLVFFEGLMKAFFRLFGLEEREMLSFSIKLHNAMNIADFERIPVSERAVFIPQCLRSSKCPAHLTGRVEVPELRAVYCWRSTDDSRKTGLPHFYRSRLFIYQTDGKEVSPESAHRCWLPV